MPSDALTLILPAEVREQGTEVRIDAFSISIYYFLSFAGGLLIHNLLSRKLSKPVQVSVFPMRIFSSSLNNFSQRLHRIFIQVSEASR
jgi:hypothetical protein